MTIQKKTDNDVVTLEKMAIPSLGIDVYLQQKSDSKPMTKDNITDSEELAVMNLFGGDGDVLYSS